MAGEESGVTFSRVTTASSNLTSCRHWLEGLDTACGINMYIIAATENASRNNIPHNSRVVSGTFCVCGIRNKVLEILFS